jgi:hypothetical protein
MNAKTRATAETASGAAKGGAAIREWIEGRSSTARGARKLANRTMAEARKQVRDTVKEARKEARRQVMRARITGARTPCGREDKGLRCLRKGRRRRGAGGLAAGYFLDPIRAGVAATWRATAPWR